MIEKIDITRALKELLRFNFPEIKSECKDIQDPIRPSFYIDVQKGKYNQVATVLEESKFSCHIVYFGADCTKLLKQKKNPNTELLKIDKKLANLLRAPIEVIIKDDFNDKKDPGILVEMEAENLDTESDTKDYFVSALFDINVIQEIPQSILDNHNSRFKDTHQSARNTNDAYMQ